MIDLLNPMLFQIGEEYLGVETRKVVEECLRLCSRPPVSVGEDSYLHDLGSRSLGYTILNSPDPDTTVNLSGRETLANPLSIGSDGTTNVVSELRLGLILRSGDEERVTHFHLIQRHFFAKCQRNGYAALDLEFFSHHALPFVFQC